MKPVPKYKTALMIWIAIYPTINLVFFLIGDFLATLPVLLRTFVLTILLVPLMVYVLLPTLSKLLAKWLQA